MSAAGLGFVGKPFRGGVMGGVGPLTSFGKTLLAGAGVGRDVVEAQVRGRAVVTGALISP